jgi:DNA invertase Pin-like site-specific DNA recombinase
VPGRDTLVVTKLDRLARSLPDARDIAVMVGGVLAEAVPLRVVVLAWIDTTRLKPAAGTAGSD